MTFSSLVDFDVFPSSLMFAAVSLAVTSVAFAAAASEAVTVMVDEGVMDVTELVASSTLGRPRGPVTKTNAPVAASSSDSPARCPKLRALSALRLGGA